jgi:post-segregation antitoxin (ccd killing protein)
MSNAVTVVIPQALREKARDHRINISEVCRGALADAVKNAEKETGDGRQAQTPDTTTCEGRAS